MSIREGVATIRPTPCSATCEWVVESSVLRMVYQTIGVTHASRKRIKDAETTEINIHDGA